MKDLFKKFFVFIIGIIELLTMLGILASLIFFYFSCEKLYSYIWDRNEPNIPIKLKYENISSDIKLEHKYRNITGNMVLLKNYAFQVWQGKPYSDEVNIKEVYYPLKSTYDNFDEEFIVNPRGFTVNPKYKFFPPSGELTILIHESCSNTSSNSCLTETPQKISSVKGMLKMNAASGIEYKGREHFKKYFPTIDLSKVHILELNSKPTRFQDVISAFMLTVKILIISFSLNFGTSYISNKFQLKES